jgi:hypothetical protein
MNSFVQYVLVGTLVTAGIVFSTWRLLSLRLRLRLLDGLNALPGVSGSAWLTRLRQRLLSQATLACGGCSKTPPMSSRQKSRLLPADPEPRSEKAPQATFSHRSKAGGPSRNQTPGALRR